MTNVIFKLHYEHNIKRKTSFYFLTIENHKPVFFLIINNKDNELED